MSKSYHKTNLLEVAINKRKKNNLTITNYSKKMFHFYKPILKILEKETQIREYFSISDKSIMRNFLTYIYLQFTEVNKIINTLNINDSRSLNTNPSIKISAIIKDHLSKSIYTDANIVSYIKKNLNNCKIVSYENTINNKKFVFEFIIYDKMNIQNLDNIVKNMLIFLQVLIKISKNLNNEINKCSKDGISITFFLTPFLKKLNITNNKNKEVLGVTNVNSGFNYTCVSSGLIFIYRKEDFFKVFVHESIHGYGIDTALHNNFNKNKNYNKFLNLFAFANKHHTNIGINEALTEFWTSLLYLCVNSYQDSKNLHSFIYNFERLYKLELVHALYQISKILEYNNLTYNTFINNSNSNSNYRENSHIFSYFIVKTLMLINNEHMLNSQLFELNNISKLENIKNNTSINIKLKHDDISVNKLFSNLYEYAKDPFFIKIMNNVEIEHRKHLNKYANKYAKKNINVHTHKLNKNLKLRTHKILTRKSKTNGILNMENYMLTNLKMMIYDYNI
jgi:hypothetical protein